MKHYPIIKFTGMILMLLLVLPSMGFAQVVTPSLDPTEPVEMPAAAGWKTGTSFGFSYQESTGNRSTDGKETVKFETDGMSGTAHFSLGNISVDGSSESSKTSATIQEQNPGRILLDKRRSKANVALLGNEFVSIGLGMRWQQTTEYEDATDDSVEINESSIIGSISVKPFENLYLGGGFERVTEKSQGKVDNVWNTLQVGLAIELGEKESTLFRVELAYISSPREEANASGELKSATHEGEEGTFAAAELMMNGLLFTASATNKRIDLGETIKINDKEYEEVTYNETEFGVLWVPQDGVLLGFYFATNRTEFSFEDENSQFRINLGYIFM